MTMFNTILEFGIFVIFMALFLSSVGYALWLRHKNAKTTSDLVQAVIDKKSLEAKMLQLSENSGKSLEQTDGFVKFLSESRDSAFVYIEETQATLVKTQKELGPIVEAYRNSEKQTDSMIQVVKSYDEIMKLLPSSD